LFPIEFNTTEADVVYLLLRTRKKINGVDTYVTDPTCYTGLAKYSNGYVSQALQAYTPNQSVFINAWNESFGKPAVVPVTLYASKTAVVFEDICNLDSLNVLIINKPAAIDQVGFLAINKTNNRFSQAESKVGLVYGLVLDNRGAWDILISPESILQNSNSGSIVYDNKSFSRQILDDDEGYDIVVTSIDAAFAKYVTLTQVPNSPQVWVMQIDPNVKRILRQRRANITNQNNLNGCSIDVDFFDNRTDG
jgi:hypothetical protein